MKSNRLTNAFIFIVILFSGNFSVGCLGPKKVNNWTATHYEGHVPPPAKKKSERIIVLSKVEGQNSALSSTEKKTSDMLPLVVYIHFDYRNTCTLNSQIPINNFTSTVNSYSPKGLKEKIKDQKLELTIEQIPATYAIDDKGTMVLLLVSWEYLSIQPIKEDLVVSYRLLNSNNEEVKSGKIDISDANKQIPVQMFQSVKKKTWEYLDQYDATITSMSKHFMDQLLTEL
ncbi:MAG: hypothetical protein C5B59_18345 [Bacteroidetes bacterium]|nr:MAG: hypothetical protein C5B59_18345 [Bacteroidota bacterium]